MEDATDFVTRERYDTLAERLKESERRAEGLALRLLEAQNRLNRITERIRGHAKETLIHSPGERNRGGGE